MLPIHISRIVSLCMIVFMITSAVVITSGKEALEQRPANSEISATGFESFQDQVNSEAVTTDLSASSEIISMRTLTTKFFDNNDGTTTARIWIKPIHFENLDGELVDFETSLRQLDETERPSANYDVGVIQNSLQAYFDMDYNVNGESPVRYSTQDGYYLAWQPGSQQLIDLASVKPLETKALSTGPINYEITGESTNIIRYHETYPGVNEEYTIGTGKITHDYILNSREHLLDLISGISEDYSDENRGDLDTFGLSFCGKLTYSDELIPIINEVNELKPGTTIKTNQGIYFKTGSGEIKHYLPPPLSYEKNDKFETIKSEYMIRKTGENELELGVLTSMEWLLDQNRVYPVVIDPDDTYIFTPDGSVGHDTFLSTDSSSRNNEIMNFGSDTEFIITLDTSTNYIHTRPILYFDLSSLPIGADVLYGKFSIYYHRDEFNDQSSFVANVYPLTKSWVEGTGTWASPSQNGACWDYYDGSNSWTKGGAHDSNYDISTEITAFGRYEWDVKSIVEKWISGSISNHGFLVKGMSGSDSVKYLRSSDYSSDTERPTLEIKLNIQQPPRVIPGAKNTINILEDSDPVYLDLRRIFEDPNEDPLRYSIWLNGWSTGPFESENITISIEENNSLMFLPRKNRWGTDTIWLSANDTVDEITFKLTVKLNSVNDPPILKTITDKKGIQGAWLNFSIRATEVDAGQENTLKFGSNVTDFDGRGTGEYSGLSITASETPMMADVSFLPTNDNVGDFSVTFWVRDYLNGEDNTSVRFSIKNRNDPPKIVSVLQEGNSDPMVVKQSKVSLITKQDEKLNLSIIVDDPDLNTPDGDLIVFDSNITSIKFTLDKKTGNITYLPDNTDVGFFYARITVSDYEGEEDSLELVIRVRNKNDPPKITGIRTDEKSYNAKNGEVVLTGDSGAYQDIYFNFTVTVDDKDLAVDPKESLIFSSNRSADFNFILDPRSGEINYLPSQASVGLYYVRIFVEDADRSEDYIDIVFEVNDVNDPPPEPDLSVVVSDEEELIISAVVNSFPILDPDGDFIICIWDYGDETEPEEKLLDSEKWSVEHTYLKPGEYQVTLTLDDSRGALVTASKTITVGDIETYVDTDDSPSLGMKSSQARKAGTEIWLILGVLLAVIIVLIVAFFIYTRTGKKYEPEDAGGDELDGDLGIAELSMLGMMPHGMHGPYGNYMGFPMHRGVMMPQQGFMTPGLPPYGMVNQVGTPVPPSAGPRLMLPPASVGFCPQCGQQTLQALTPDGQSFGCPSCGFRR